MDEIEQIKQRIDIVEFISSYLTTKKAGQNYRALCPFHNEKTPSMMISPEKQIFKCFGCGEGGDVFAFVMKMENLNFRETLEMLAQRTGVKLQRRTTEQTEQETKEKDSKTRLYRINSLSAQVFHKILLTHPSAKEALAYLKKRKITEQTMREFVIGYAPSSRFLTTFLKQKGFTEAEIAAAGSPDRFFERIIFPITDVMGNVLGFTGRVLKKDVQPKYLNTPETIIFHKGRILYNLVRARGEIKLAQTSVVVEGQMDVIASYQAGVKNVVATSGTALTPDHLLILYRYTPNITFAFDADSAGQNTSKKAYEMALEAGFNVKMVNLSSPKGEFKDPGEMIEANPPAGGPVLWLEAVKSARPVIDWYFSLAFKNQNQELSSQQKKEIAKELLPIIKKIPDSIEQAHYIELLSQKLAVPDTIIFEALEKVKSDIKPTIKGDLSPKANDQKKILPEEILIGVLVNKPEILVESVKNITPDDFTDSWAKKVYSSVLNWYNDNDSNHNSSSKKTTLSVNLKDNLSSTEIGRLEMVLMEVAQDYTRESSVVAKDIIAGIKQKKREKLKAHFAREIKQAESQGDKAKLKSLIKEFQDAIR